MADSDGEYVEDGSDDDFLDHQVTTSSHDPSSSSRRAAAAGAAASTGASNSAGGPPSRRTRRGAQRKAPSRAAWEDVKRSWETVVEDPDGSLALSGLLDAELRRRRRLLQDTTPLQRGIIRHLVLVLDQSLAMLERDMLPNRHRRVAQHAATFVREFFEQNPISQLGIVGMRDGVAVRISDMGGNPAEHLERLKEAEAQDPQGNPSLQNALEMCRGALFHAPSHGTREVLIVYGALLSSDPGDIHDTIASLVADRIRVSIVGLSAQVAICAELCARTNTGDDSASTYRVALDEDHFRDLLLSATTPPVTRELEQAPASLLMMGFPSRALATTSTTTTAATATPAGAGAGTTGGGGGGTAAGASDDAVVYCACHNRPGREGYICTRCGTRVCRLPAECPACGLTLILSTHLARSYHHLFPLRNWVEVPWERARVGPRACYACLAPFPEPPSRGAHARGSAPAPTQKITIKVKGKAAAPAKTASSSSASAANPTSRAAAKASAPAPSSASAPPPEIKGISESSRYMCEVCGNYFCIDCDLFAHEVIHNCPGCQSDTRAWAAEADGEQEDINMDGMNGHVNGTTAMVVD